MQKNWPPFEEQLNLNGATPDFTFEEVIAHYHGPQIAVATFRDERFLAVAADEEVDQGVSRWLLSEASPTDLLAIKTGAQTLREALESNSTIWVIDLDSNQAVVQASETSATQLADECLPARQATLPSGICREFRRQLSEAGSEIHIDGEGVASQELPFKIASDLFGAIQRLWNALAQVESDEHDVTDRAPVPGELKERSQLAMTALGGGSARVEVSAGDATLHERISEQYGCLLKSRFDERQFHENLDRLGPRVESAFQSVTKAVAQNEVSVFSTGQTPGYLNPHLAEGVQSLIAMRDANESVRRAHGYFVAFDQESGTFGFRELESQREFEGDVAPEVLEANDEVSVGEAQNYEVEMSITRHFSPTDQERGEEIELTRIQRDI